MYIQTRRARALATATFALLALTVGCRDQEATFAPPDTGVVIQQQTCTENTDCTGGICVGGICEAVVACTDDTACAPSGKVCHTTRNFCVECDGRHEGECADGFTCQFDFTCVSIGGTDGGTPTMDAGACSGSCGDRTECAVDQVCRGGSCCAPPPRCAGPADCPLSMPECNGATGACFGGDSCSGDSDCENRPGCAGGACFCDQASPGQPGVCRARPDECQMDSDCGDPSQFCTIDDTPKLCLPAPTCASDIDCGNVNLICDSGTGRCRNGAECPMGNECGATQFCNNGRCVGQNCINTPTLCTAEQTCNQASGRCEANQSTQCMADGDCSQGFYCNTALGMCLVGCRDSSECPGGICNAAHQCESAAGGLCGSCATDADCPAGTTCYESTLTMTKTCRESCSIIRGQDCMIDATATCFIAICSCGP